MNPAELDIDALLKRLHLANSRRVYTTLADRAERERWSYRDYLGLLMAEEIAHRQQTGVQKRTRHARFPFLKTIDDFNFAYQSSLRLTMLGSYLGPDFVTEGRNLILYGKTGRGKTHLAVAIAYRAIQNGFDARFVTAAVLIDDLSHAGERGRFREALAVYTHPHVLVIDEVGYLTYGPDAANVLYHVVNDRYLRRRPMIFTTNKPLREWGRVLHDDDLARAIGDRTLERGRLITLDGPSQRTRHLQIDPFEDPEVQAARVSGKERPEFPEPAKITRTVSRGEDGLVLPTGMRLAKRRAARFAREEEHHARSRTLTEKPARRPGFRIGRGRHGGSRMWHSRIARADAPAAAPDRTGHHLRHGAFEHGNAPSRPAGRCPVSDVLRNRGGRALPQRRDGSGRGPSRCV
jgi:DNA replication protein DnaC